MKRREFFSTSAAATFGLATAGLAQAASPGGGKDVLEWRRYSLDSPAKQKAFEAILANAAIPALNRAGVKPVGVFKMLKADNPKLKIEEDSNDLFVLLPHKSAESVVTLIARLAQDSWFTSEAAEALMAPKESPAYKRFESSLFLSFDKCPRVEVPTLADTRVLQLRIYESHNDERALAKIHMFNEGGEIAIFRKVGLDPVFFGQALIGELLPNLTYMLSFKNADEMGAAWGRFGKDPGWQALRQDETYKDTVSRITNIVLRPAKGSQV